MSLQLLFDPISPELSEGYEHYSFIGQRIIRHEKEFPDWKGCDLALIGLTEDRGNPENEGAHSGADFLRGALYGLKATHVTYKIADLGNLRPGDSLEDSHLRLKEVVRTLLEFNVVPIIIGGTHDHTLPIVMAYEELERKINLVNIDSRSDTEAGMQRGLAHHHIGRILTRHKQMLNRYYHLAYQTYLVDENILAAIDQHHHHKMRIGEMRANFAAVEPVVRTADVLSFDISAIRMSEAPANACAFPFGLTGEEACQLAWFSGCSSKLSCFGLFELNPGMDYRETTSKMAATMIWYFIEGFYNRTDDVHFSHTDSVRHVVMLEGTPTDSLNFIQHIVSGKWWVQLPPTEEFPDGEMLPCTETDYHRARSGEIPPFWLNHLINLS